MRGLLADRSVIRPTNDLITESGILRIQGNRCRFFKTLYGLISDAGPYNQRFTVQVLYSFVLLVFFSEIRNSILNPS